MMTESRSRRFISTLALIIALLIAVGLPAAYGLIRGAHETEMLSLRARMNAARVGKYIYANERVWRYQGVRIGPLIESAEATATPVNHRLLLRNGSSDGEDVVLDEGVALPGPLLTVRVPIEVSGRTVAFLEASTSQRPLLLHTALAGLVGLVIGTGAWLAVRLLPLRALDETMRELVEQHTKAQEALHEADMAREKEQAAAEANKAKSGFLAMMSHEIRTPMNAVLGLAGTLLDNDLPVAQRKVVEAIRDSGDNLLRILNDILDFSKLDASRMTLENAPFAPSSLTNSVASILSTRAAAKGLRILALCEPSMPDGLLGDSGRLRQILINLASNAVKFTTVGQVSITARCLSRTDAMAEGEGALAEVEWEVADTGIGIASDRLGTLFNEFTQADSSIARRFGGTGLGLAISKRLIEQMQGTISVESIPHVGTVFRIRLSLPVADRPVEESVSQTSGVVSFQVAAKKFGRTPRVLFAEDNPTNQFVARELLKDLDLQLDMVSDGLEAVDAAFRFPYDVICMDMQMPEMDGLEATRLIRARGGALARVPIIALTANAFPEDVRACLDAGMSQFVAKPVSRDVLLTALQLALFGNMPVDPPALLLPSETAAPAMALDLTAVEGLKAALGPEGMVEMLAMFDDDTLSRLRRLETGDLDRATMVREVHSLKGAASTVCATDLAHTASALEKRLKMGEPLLAADLTALRRCFEEYRVAVAEICPEPAEG